MNYEFVTLIFKMDFIASGINYKRRQGEDDNYSLLHRIRNSHGIPVKPFKLQSTKTDISLIGAREET